MEEPDLLVGDVREFFRPLRQSDEDLYVRATQFLFAVIGAGAGGICAGIRLLEPGRDHFVIEREPRVGRQVAG